MAETHRSHDIATAEMFRRDPLLAAEYLNTVLADGDDVDIIMALKNLSAAFGHTGSAALHSGSKPASQTILKQVPPSVTALRALLSTMGMRLSVQPIE